MMKRTTGWRLALVATALCGVARGDDAAVLRRLDALGRNAVTYATDADRRLTEIAVVAGVSPTALGNCRAMIAKVSATTA